jgi:hypothetical protein
MRRRGALAAKAEVIRQPAAPGVAVPFRGAGVPRAPEMDGKGR